MDDNYHPTKYRLQCILEIEFRNNYIQPPANEYLCTQNANFLIFRNSDMSYRQMFEGDYADISAEKSFGLQKSQLFFVVQMMY